MEHAVGGPSNNQHRNILRCGRDSAADYPDNGCELDGVASAKVIWDKSGGEGTEEGSPRHCSSNATLFDVGGVVKVIGILSCPEKCRQWRDIWWSASITPDYANSERTKPKKASANDLLEISNLERKSRIWTTYAGCADEIGVVDFLHHVEVGGVHTLRNSLRQDMRWRRSRIYRWTSGEFFPRWWPTIGDRDTEKWRSNTTHLEKLRSPHYVVILDQSSFGEWSNSMFR